MNYIQKCCCLLTPIQMWAVFNLFIPWTLTEFCVFLSFLKTVSVGRRKFSANFQLMFRLIKGLIFLTFVSILVTLIALPHMTVQDIIVCILAFMPTGWGILLVSYKFLSKYFFIHIPYLLNSNEGRSVNLEIFDFLLLHLSVICFLKRFLM